MEEMDERIILMKDLLSAAEGTRRTDKHSEACGGRWHDAANEGQRNFLVNH